MKKVIYLILLIFVCNISYSQDIRSNHSYKNLGFTQLPTVTIHGWIEGNASQTRQTNDYSKNYINNTIYPSWDEVNQQFSWTSSEINAIQNRFVKHKTIFSNEATILFKIQGINDFGLLYGGVIEFNANSTDPAWTKDIATNKSYIYLESMLGKVEFGSELGASKKMKVDAGTISAGNGGVAGGKYLNYINFPSIINYKRDTRELAEIPNDFQTPLYILIPELPTSHSGYGVGYNNYMYQCDLNSSGTIDDTSEYECYNARFDTKNLLYFKEMENSLKISYYTPEIYGFQLGVSYTPDTGNKGIAGRTSTKINMGDVDEVIQYGATFNNNLYGISISLSFTGERGKSEDRELYYHANDVYNQVEAFRMRREKLKAYQYGGVLSYYGLSIAGSKGIWGKSLYYKEDTYNMENYTYDPSTNTYILNSKNISISKSHFYTLGMAYEFIGFNLSVTHFSSEFQENRYIATSIDLDYKIASGFTPYVSATKFVFKDKKNRPDPVIPETYLKRNEGWVLISGILLSF